MIKHLCTRSFMLMILLSFGWEMIAQEQPPDEPDDAEAVVPVFDLTGSDTTDPSAQVPLFNLRPAQGLTSTMMGLTTTVYAFSQDFDDPSNWEGVLPDVVLAAEPGRTGKGLRIDPKDFSVSLEHGYLRDLNLQMDLALNGSRVQMVAKGSGAGEYLVTLSADGRVELSRSGVLLGEAQFAVAEWLRVTLVMEGTQIAIGIDGNTLIRATDPNPLPPGVMSFVAEEEGSYTLDNLVFSGVIAPPAPESLLDPETLLRLEETANTVPVEQRLLYVAYTAC